VLGNISTQLHQHTRYQPFQKFFKRSRVQLRAHFVRVCRGCRFNAAAQPQHAAASSLFPGVHSSLSCVHMSYSAMRSCGSGSAVFWCICRAPPCCSGHSPQPARTKLSVSSHVLDIARACCLAALPPITPATRVCCTSSA
jgi:hypothetical protein